MPEVTGASVVFTPSFHIMHLEAMALQVGERHSDMIELTARKDLANKRCILALATAELTVRALGRASYGMMQVEPAWVQ